jgi:hypothetical protein
MGENERISGHVKGAAVHELLVWYEHELGRDRLTEAVQRVPLELRSKLGLDFGRDSLGILTSRWYDSEAMFSLLDVVGTGLGAAERIAVGERAADAVIRKTLRGVYRVLFSWLATPERYASFAERLWRSYYDTGTMAVVSVGERAVCTIRDWRSHSQLGCEMNRAAAMAIYRAMGCAGVTTRREACVGEGASECRFVTTWQGRGKPPR